MLQHPEHCDGRPRANPAARYGHDIAQRLHLSVKTIHNLHYQIKTRLGVDSDIQLTRLAMSWGLDLSLTLNNRAPDSARPTP